MPVIELYNTTAQRPLHWRPCLRVLRYEIMHVSGAENCWGNILSRWTTIGDDANGEALGSVALRTVAVFACTEADYTLPSKNATKASQVGVLAASELEYELVTQFGQAEADSVGLFNVSWAEKVNMWIPDASKHLQVRLIVCAHIGACGHRGQASTLNSGRTGRGAR